MLLRQQPINMSEYIGVNGEQSDYLEHMGFIPKYLYDGVFFYKISKELMECLNKGGGLNG